VTGGKPAELHGPYGEVILSPAGVRLCAAALMIVANLTDEEVASALHRRRPGRGDGAAPLTDDVAYLRTVLRLAQDRAAGNTSESYGERVTILLPSSEARLTTAEAAAILGVSEQAVRAAARQGRYGAARPGRDWSLSEWEVRMAAGKGRRRGRRADGDRSGSVPAVRLRPGGVRLPGLGGLGCVGGRVA
jgi:excisionase family DNA binding protein